MPYFSLNEEWRLNEHVPKVELPELAKIPRDGPKLMVCHDMAGGYTEEDNDPERINIAQLFTLHYWNLIDSFVYFSHHRITIPPKQWTELAHKNGVMSLGTVIFEWKESIPDVCLFVENRIESCEKLIKMAEFYKLDGWLFNFEVEVTQELAVKIHDLITYLTPLFKSRIKHGMIIWYDGMTIEGKLKWQNKVTMKNVDFFNSSCGIFTNYTWKHDYPAESALLVKERNYDVYTGIDVFGRGSYAGMFDSYKAVEVCKKSKTSVALFAPGWIYETMDRNNFLLNEKALWDPISKLLDPRPIYLQNMEFESSFSTAGGPCVFENGERTNECCSNHSFQSVFAGLEQDGVSVSMEQAYNGNSCLKIEKSVIFRFVPEIMMEGFIIFSQKNIWEKKRVKTQTEGVLRIDLNGYLGYIKLKKSE